ncbi:MAG: metallophosphoesterase [Bacteroidota bacterium]|nr:metallophosphoesterase [Bacteroidota bacterium]
MIIQYCSDLHLEFRENEKFLKQNPIQPTGEILILAGDILPFALQHKFNWFFDYLSDNFQHTYWIPGNHEYYNNSIDNFKFPLHEKIKDNVSLLNNQVVIYKNVELIFSTLWGHISVPNHLVIERSVSDFSLIKCNGKKLTPIDFNQLHKTDLAFIKSALAVKSDNQRIIITHHVPTLQNYPSQYKNSNINEAFAVELYDFIFESQANYWIYGHHHTNTNTPGFKIGNTTLLTNQLGYVQQNEHKLYCSNAVIKIDRSQNNK